MSGAKYRPDYYRSKPIRARGRPRQTHGSLNRLEADYASRLELKRLAGEIASYRFESVKLRLADRTWYAPDFLVIGTDGILEFHEVKGGHFEDDARVKIKVAAEAFPEFRFVVARRPRATRPRRRSPSPLTSSAIAWEFEEIRGRQGPKK